MKIPSVIKDRGLLYTVEITDKMPEDTDGFLSYNDCKIMINRKVCEQKILETLLHELCHLSLYGTSLRMLFKNADTLPNGLDVEEEFVYNFSMRLYGILKDNNLLRE
jgi:hypothetical protein